MIPPFGPNGILPPGIYETDWRELTDRFGWTPRRQELLVRLRAALEALAVAGCKQVYINGSFVTSKEEPGDFDGCWDVEGVNPTLLDPVLLDFRNSRAAQKAKYGGELFLAAQIADLAGTTFLDFFQVDKQTGEPKGIVRLDPRRLQ
jgi:hypothetical protein